MAVKKKKAAAPKKTKAAATAAKANNAAAVKKIKLKKKTNLMKLHSVMNKMAENAVDNEVIKKFKIIIEASEFDITKTALDGILKRPEEVVIKNFHESLHAYINHYLYMEKKNKKMAEKNKK